MIAWLRRIGIVVGVVLAVATLAGAAFERTARRRTARAHPMVGRLVEVAPGRRLHLDCRGSGTPTVLLESGLDMYGSLAWAAVHDSIARTTRVCAYSRAGIMWSDAANEPFDSRRNARDLHTALTRAGESGPWVVVGHSLGGPYVITFTQLFRDEVRGVVLVDASHPDQVARMREAAGRSMVPPSGVLHVGSALAWTGLVRMLTSSPLPATWPREVREAGPPFLPTSLAALARETDVIAASLDGAGASRSLGDVPLVVLTAGRGLSPDDLKQNGISAQQGRKLDELHLAMQADEATWSRHSRQEIVSDASHYIQFDRPDVVIRAVRDVVADASCAAQRLDAVRSSASRSPRASFAASSFAQKCMK